jgi:P27 family predicted phage terminase small subunit
MCQQLVAIGLYTVIDHAMLEMYCQAYGDWIEAKRKIRETGGRVLRSRQGQLYTNPWVHEANGAWERLRKASAEFGMTPSSRSRVRVATAEHEPSLEEQLFAMVGGAKVKDGDGGG